MKISISVTNPSFAEGAAAGLRRVAGLADDSGIDTLWVADHLVQVDPTVRPGDTDHLEVCTTLGYLAAATDRIRLGSMVSPAMFREPAVLVAAVTSLAVLTGGRAWFGVGAGHQQEEAADLGLPFPSVRERMDRLEDTLVLARQVWSGDERPFEGSTATLRRPRLSPLPPTRPRILVGGTGEQRTLRLVAGYADACNLFDIPDEGRTVRRKLAVLAGHCADLGRDPAGIETTLSSRLDPAESAEDLAARCRTAAGWGIEHLVLITSAPWHEQTLATVAAAVEQVVDVTADTGWRGSPAP